MIRRTALALALMSAAAVWAQGYPNKPVKLVVPYPPGGPTDIVARVIAERLQAQTGQTFVVENKAGAGGNLGAESVARAPADGYTLLVATTAHAINMSVFKQLNYDVKRDFAPVSLLTQGPLVLVVHPATGMASVKDVIAKAKADAGGLPYASSGNGQSTHLSAELFASMAGVKFNHVPYKGSAPALNDLVAGHVNAMLGDLQNVSEQLKGGTLRAIAVANESRLPSMPDLPTLDELGVKGFTSKSWFGAIARKETPPEIVTTWSAAFADALKRPTVRQRLGGLGIELIGSTPEAMQAFLREEAVKAEDAVKASGAKAE
jgi:tripartite-type tricarboxylate transporter receptor subunit TctC